MKLCTYEEFFDYMDSNGFNQHGEGYVSKATFEMLCLTINPYFDAHPEVFRTNMTGSILRDNSDGRGYLKLRFRHMVIFGLSLPLKEVPLYVNCADPFLHKVLSLRLKRGG